MKPRIAIPQPRSNPEYVAQVMPQYSGAVTEAGGEPVEIALDLDNERIARIAVTCDGVLLPGSPADLNPEKYGAVRDPHTADPDPLRDNADELLLQDAYNMRKPVLGICFGLQSLNVWRSGSLRQHLSTGTRHSDDAQPNPASHAVMIDAASRLGRIIHESLAATNPLFGVSPEYSEGAAFLELKVNSSHHQAVLKPGDGLRVAAWCPDDQVIEAVEGTAADHWVIAVQWHPERMLQDAAAYGLFLAFVQAARERRRYPRTSAPDFESTVPL